MSSARSSKQHEHAVKTSRTENKDLWGRLTPAQQASLLGRNRFFSPMNSSSRSSLPKTTRVASTCKCKVFKIINYCRNLRGDVC